MFGTYKNMRKVIDANENLYEISDSDRKEIQQTLVEMLEEISAFCDKHHLMYALCGGSCLGAVRHKGFIPWDDDMDICMPRADYEKFIYLFSSLASSKYWVQNIKTTKKYDLHFSKVRKKETCFEEVYESEVKKAGIFIDIFPIDNTFNSVFLRKIHQLSCDGLLFICSCVRMHGKFEKLLNYVEEDKKVKRSLTVKNILGTFFSFLPLRCWMLITEFVISFNQNRNSKYVIIPSGIGHAMGEIYKRKWFFPSKKIRFEGKKFSTLNHPSPYLTKLYGDYMVIPPEKDRLHHNVVHYNQ